MRRPRWKLSEWQRRLQVSLCPRASCFDGSNPDWTTLLEPWWCWTQSWCCLDCRRMAKGSGACAWVESIPFCQGMSLSCIPSILNVVEKGDNLKIHFLLFKMRRFTGSWADFFLPRPCGSVGTSAWGPVVRRSPWALLRPRQRAVTRPEPSLRSEDGRSLAEVRPGRTEKIRIWVNVAYPLVN